MITKGKEDFLFGLDKIKDKVIKYCKVLMSTDNEYEIIKRRLSITPTFLFYGYPGTGKTSLANEVYEILKEDNEYGNIDKYILKIDEMLSSNFGESSKNLISKFNEIREEIKNNNSRAFIIIDEIDYFTNNRFENNNDSITRVLLSFNQIIDDLIRSGEIDRMIIIATTNIKQNIDTSILRRFFFHEDFNIILEKEKFNEYLNELFKITNIEISNNIGELYKIYTDKKFTLGELKKIFSRLYMDKQIGIKFDENLIEIIRDTVSYHEIILKQQGGK